MIFLFFAFLVISNTVEIDLDASLDQVGLIERWGYPVEKYEVTTRDGYILDLIRIPRGKNDDRNISRPAILLVHGLLTSGSQWIMNLPHQSAGFVYADSGLDVFIANVRGTTYGRRHLKMNPDHDSQFWKYSFDHMARYDLPAIIDRSLSISGQDQLYYMGDSQGTLISLLLLSDLPRYNNKINKLFLISPVATGHYIRGFLQVLISSYSTLYPMTDVWRLFMGSQEILGYTPLLVSAAKIICSMPTQEACYDFMYLAAGPPDFDHFNTSRVEVYVSNFPAGTSTRNLLHWAQISSRESIAHYDFNNPIENMLHYGKLNPPTYNYTEIEVPIYFYWSRNDWLTTPMDIFQDLLPKLRKGLVKGAFEIPEYNHLDFVIATTVADRVYKPVLDIIRSDI
ncbi:hypothetical protein PENTCL1PPCAC_17552, partial [Pristionchus entomophagus]